VPTRGRTQGAALSVFAWISPRRRHGSAFHVARKAPRLHRRGLPCTSGPARLFSHGTAAGGGVMDLGIRGRRALVNGASAGMGRAAGEMLAMEGVDLVICARGRERLEEAARALRRHGVSVTAVAADHSTKEGRAKVLAACPDPDILVATCSPPPLTPDHTAITPEQWRSALEIGLMSPVRFI